MALEAPYKGREPAPAKADKADVEPADKPEELAEVADDTITADKPKAPPEEAPDVEKEEVEETEEEAEPAPEQDIAGTLRHADYTRKSQENARQREALEREKASLNQRFGVYEQVDQLLIEHPEYARTHTVEQIVEMIRSGQGPTGQSPIPPEYQRQLSAIEGRLRMTTETLFLGQVKATMKKVSGEYGLTEAEQKTVVELAVKRGKLDNPEAAPEDIEFDLDLIANKVAAKRAVADGQRKFAKKLVEKGRAASGGTRAAPTDSEADRPRPKGWEALTAQLIAEQKARTRSG